MVACVLVTYNRSLLLDQILSTVTNFSWEYSDFILINNASTDDTVDMLSKYELDLRLSIIHLKENIGHGAGLAKALKYLNKKENKPDFVVFLEDDSIPEKQYLDFLINSIQKSSFTLISSSGYKVKLGKRIKILSNQNYALEADFGVFDGAIARLKDLSHVGFPIENWFMMFDDFEYCYRIKLHGYTIGVIRNPYIKIMNEGWGGGNSHSHLWRTYYQARNYILFVKMHFTWFNFFDALILQAKRLIGELQSKNRIQITKMRLLGIWAGLQSKTGKSLDIKTLKEV